MASELKQFVKEMEGIRLMPYRCPAGKLTIGYGHNLECNGISKEVAEELLDDDLSEAAMATSKLIPVTDQIWFNIATDMVFNMGLTTFKTFKNFIKHINKSIQSICRKSFRISHYVSTICSCIITSK